MPFASDLQVQNRLGNDPAPLTRQEIIDMCPYLKSLGEPHLRILWAQLALLTMQALDENRTAIQRFDDSSSSLTTRIYWLTWALVALTVVLTVFTVLLWLKA